MYERPITKGNWSKSNLSSTLIVVGLSSDRALNRFQMGGLAQYVRRFYELLGNRRKSERVPISGSIRVICEGYAVDTTHACSVVDISRGGIAIDCPEPIAVDAVVQLQPDEQGPRRPARIRYCIQRCDLYRVGLEFIAPPE
jgi:hypothetical protein